MTELSTRPSVAAYPLLVVASASKPSEASSKELTMDVLAGRIHVRHSVTAAQARLGTGTFRYASDADMGPQTTAGHVMARVVAGNGWSTKSALAAIVIGMYCEMTGRWHRLFWMRSAWWCADCRQKVESCCDGGCPSIAEALLADSAAQNVAKPVTR